MLRRRTKVLSAQERKHLLLSPITSGEITGPIQMGFLEKNWRMNLFEAPISWLKKAIFVTLMVVTMSLNPGPVHAQGFVPTENDATSGWQRSIMKAVTFQITANITDLALFGVFLGSATVTGTTFLVANAASSAALYFSYDYFKQLDGKIAAAKTGTALIGQQVGLSNSQATVLDQGQENLIKTIKNEAVFPLLNSARNFGLGFIAGGGVVSATSFMLGNFVTDTAIYFGNEFAWNTYWPFPEARSTVENPK
jgi:hypothetical protein